MNQTNCHNCGAPITGPECEYCGTRFNIRMVEPIKYTDADARRKEIEEACGVISPNEARAVIGLDPRWGVRRN